MKRNSKENEKKSVTKMIPFSEEPLPRRKKSLITGNKNK